MELETKQKLQNILAQHGGQWVDLPNLLPSNILLELTGETLRPRLYFANSPDGEEFCLRADLTIPAAMEFINSGKNCDSTAIYLCSGKVFRAPKNIKNKRGEFRQMGIEHYGENNKIDADICVFNAIFESCQFLGLTKPKAIFNDGGILKYIISNANISQIWRDFLLSEINNITTLKERIIEAAALEKQKPNEIETSLLNQDDATAAQSIQNILDKQNLSAGLIRNPLVIAKRLKAKAMRAIAEALPQNIVDSLFEILKINEAPESAIDKITIIAAKIGVNLDDWKNDWHTRLAQIKDKIGDDYNNIEFNAALPKRFEYYDGFFFEICCDNDPQNPVASGGRYDSLIGALSNGKTNINAVGATLRLDRIGSE